MTTKKEAIKNKKATAKRYGVTQIAEHSVVLTFRMIKNHVWCDECLDVHDREAHEDRNCTEIDWYTLFTRTITSEKDNEYISNP